VNLRICFEARRLAPAGSGPTVAFPGTICSDARSVRLGSARLGKSGPPRSVPRVVCAQTIRTVGYAIQKGTRFPERKDLPVERETHAAQSPGPERCPDKPIKTFENRWWTGVALLFFVSYFVVRLFSETSILLRGVNGKDTTAPEQIAVQ